MTDLRISDLTPDDTLRVYCTCGRIVEYLHSSGIKDRLPPNKRIADIRFVCTKCGAKSGHKITIFDERTRGDSSKRRETVIVAGDEDERAVFLTLKPSHVK